MGNLGFGIDGGGTHARLQVFDLQTGSTLCRVTGNSTNIYSIPIKTVFDNIRELFRMAGFSASEFACGCLGSAGLSRPSEIGLFREFFAEYLPGCPVYLCNDGEVLLTGKLQSPSGYCLIAGTGSLALGRGKDGSVVRSGGLGYMLGDEGSALWISWCAIRRSLRSLEGRDIETKMLPSLMSFFKISDPTDFIALLHHHFDKASIAAAAPIVLNMIEEDPLALDIAENTADELVSLVKSVRKQMPDANHILAISGGVLKNNEWIKNRFIDKMVRVDPSVKIISQGGEAVDGACLLAKEAFFRSCSSTYPEAQR